MKNVLIAVTLAFSITPAIHLSQSCISEFAKLPETQANFNAEQFLKELPAEVAKVKAQQKLPFGKPADSKKTDIGITVGCLKQFPESASAIAPMLKDLSLEMTKNTAASKLSPTEKSGGKEAAKNKDIIYMQSEQEIKNAVIIEIGVEELKYKIGAREIVYVVKKADISSILYADGEKEFFCNGISYNSATHSCHSDNKTYSCGNKPYNPATQSCTDNAIYDKCGENLYNTATHFCHTDSQTYSCANKPYNPATQFCSDDNQILNKCSENIYNPLTHFCHADGKTYSCANKPYNPTTHFCYNNNQILDFKCGNKYYNPSTQFCEHNQLFDKCGGNVYNPLTHLCHSGQTYSCGGKAYNPATHDCKSSKIVKR